MTQSARWESALQGVPYINSIRQTVAVSIDNLTPADVYFGRGQAILKQRERIKLKTMDTRRLQYRKYAA